MTTDAQLQCPNCGAGAVEDSSTCGTCGASLLVDVCLAGSRVDARVAFQAARALAALGAPAPAFQEARDRLTVGTGPVVARVSRSFAANVIRTLKDAGVDAVTRSNAQQTNRSRTTWAIAAVALAGIVAGVAALWSRATAVPDVPPAAPVTAAATAPDVSPDAASPPPRDVLTIQEIGKRARASVASIRCDKTVGAGFFIGSERLITNAHVACRGPDPLAITLADGRNLLGKVVSRDEWQDLALVDVLGANASPLKVGDTTAVEVGDPVVFIGSPKGLQFTLHEGRVSFVGRNLGGLAYLQLNASINPGNSGGPLFNERGEVLAIVSMKAVDADGIGFALPLEYAEAPSREDARARWTTILARVAAEDVKDQEAERAQLQPGKPVLVGSRGVDGRGVMAIIMQRWTTPPHGLSHQFALGFRGQKPCTLKANFTNWSSLKDASVGEPDSRRLTWMLRNGLTDGVYLGGGLLESVDCLPAELVGERELVLREGGRDRGHVSIDASDLLREARPSVAPQQRQQEEIVAANQADEERSWRIRFQRARQKILLAEQRVEAARQEIARLDRLVASGTHELTAQGRAAYLQLQERVAGRDPEKAAAQAELHELERQAAFAAVPNEWRR